MCVHHHNGTTSQITYEVQLQEQIWPQFSCSLILVKWPPWRQYAEEMPRKLPRRLGSLPRHPPPVRPPSYCSSSLHFVPTQPSAYRQDTQFNSKSVFQTTHLPSMKQTVICSTLVACSPTFSSTAKSPTKCPALVFHTSSNAKSPYTPPNSPTESFRILSCPPRGQLLSARPNKTHFNPKKRI